MNFQTMVRLPLLLILVGITQLDGKPLAGETAENKNTTDDQLLTAFKDESPYNRELESQLYRDDLNEAIGLRASEFESEKKTTAKTPLVDNYYNFKDSDFQIPDYKPPDFDFKIPDYKPIDYKPIDYNFNTGTEDHSTYYYRSGVNGYHVSGGFAVLAVFLLMIRCGLLCCRLNNNTRRTTTSGVIVVRETPVQALIITTRQRSNSVDGLIKNEEAPADDPPPAYEDCAENEAAPNTNLDEDRPPAYST